MKPFGFHREARQELIDAAARYATISPDLGRRFAEHIDRLVAEICTGPQRFRAFEPPVQRHFRRGFPFAVLYLNQPERVWIVAVMHFRQEPGYWRRRLG